MLKQKILKLAKTINKFTLDDLIIFEEDEENILSALEELIKGEFIKKIDNNSYIVLENAKKTAKNKDYKLIRDVKITEMAGYSEFITLPPIDRKAAYKYIAILKESHGLKGKEVERFVKSWNIKNPKCKTSYNSVYTARRKFLNNGLMGLASNYRNNRRYFSAKGKDIIIKKQLLYRFAELYLSDKKLSQEECITIAVKENNKRMYVTKTILSQKQYFLEYIKKYYSDKEIDFYRKSKKEKLLTKPELNLYFNVAVEKYLEYIKTQKAEYLVEKTRSIIRNSLKMYFEQYRLLEINFEIINIYIKQEQDKNISKRAIYNSVFYLRSILKHFYPEYCNFKMITSAKSKETIENNLKILSVNEIKQVLREVQKTYPEIYPVVLTVLTTGMYSSEALALSWSDIDFSKNQIKVNKCLLSGKKISFSMPLLGRIINCPSFLMQVLKKHKKNQNIKSNIVFSTRKGEYCSTAQLYTKKISEIFNSLGFERYSLFNLRDTYISLLIQSGMPLNHIQKLAGFSSINSIFNRFDSIITEKPLDEVFSFMK